MKKFAVIFMVLALFVLLPTMAFAADGVETITSGEATITLTNVAAVETKTVTVKSQNWTEPRTAELPIYYLNEGATISATFAEDAVEPFVQLFTVDCYLKDGIYTDESEEEIWGFNGFFLSEGEPSELTQTYDGLVYCGDLFCYTFAAPTTTETTTTTENTTTTETTTETTTPATTGGTTTTAADGTVTYTTKAGDTMGFISTNFYGNNAQHRRLYNANLEAFKATGGRLQPGMTLIIPETLGGVKRIAAPVLGEGESFYTVKAGDTLGAIAASTYGDIMQYKAIFERNNDRLKNANLIYEGQVIVLPKK